MSNKKAAVIFTIAAIAFMLYLFRKRIAEAWKKVTEKASNGSIDQPTNDTSGAGSGGSGGAASGGGSGSDSGGGSNDPDCAACGMSEPPAENTSMLDQMLPPNPSERIYNVLMKSWDGDDGKIRGDYGKVLVHYGIVSFTVKVRQADNQPVESPRRPYRIVAEVRNGSELAAFVVSQAFQWKWSGDFPYHSFTVYKKTTETGQELPNQYLALRTGYSITAWAIDAETGETLSDHTEPRTARTGS